MQLPPTIVQPSKVAQTKLLLKSTTSSNVANIVSLILVMDKFAAIAILIKITGFN